MHVVFCAGWGAWFIHMDVSASEKWGAGDVTRLVSTVSFIAAVSLPCGNKDTDKPGYTVPRIRVLTTTTSTAMTKVRHNAHVSPRG